MNLRGTSLVLHKHDDAQNNTAKWNVKLQIWKLGTFM
jgi:hypothetical protein